MHVCNNANNKATVLYFIFYLLLPTSTQHFEKYKVVTHYLDVLFIVFSRYFTVFYDKSLGDVTDRRLVQYQVTLLLSVPLQWWLVATGNGRQLRLTDRERGALLVTGLMVNCTCVTAIFTNKHLDCFHAVGSLKYPPMVTLHSHTIRGTLCICAFF